MECYSGGISKLKSQEVRWLCCDLWTIWFSRDCWY